MPDLLTNPPLYGAASRYLLARDSAQYDCKGLAIFVVGSRPCIFSLILNNLEIRVVLVGMRSLIRTMLAWIVY